MGRGEEWSGREGRGEEWAGGERRRGSGEGRGEEGGSGGDSQHFVLSRCTVRVEELMQAEQNSMHGH